MRAQQNTDEQRARFFDAFDGDRDGKLSKEELVRPTEEIHLVVGAKGSQLQLVLNTIFHVSEPAENIPYEFYKEFLVYKDENGATVRGRFTKYVDLVVPYCLGDSYKGYRVVGTTSKLFDKFPYSTRVDGTKLRYEFVEGRNFQRKNFFEAVVGGVAARKLGLKIGVHIHLTHGIEQEENAHVHDKTPFQIVGILNPTSTPNDRALFVNMEGFFLIPPHQKPVDDGENREPPERIGGERLPLPEKQREVTTLLVRCPNDLVAAYLKGLINSRNIAQAAQPTQVIDHFLAGENDLTRFMELGRAIKSSGGELEREKFENRGK